jgi:hypothetical protein
MQSSGCRAVLCGLLYRVLLGGVLMVISSTVSCNWNYQHCNSRECDQLLSSVVEDMSPCSVLEKRRRLSPPVSVDLRAQSIPTEEWGSSHDGTDVAVQSRQPPWRDSVVSSLISMNGYFSRAEASAWLSIFFFRKPVTQVPGRVYLDFKLSFLLLYRKTVAALLELIPPAAALVPNYCFSRTIDTHATRWHFCMVSISAFSSMYSCHQFPWSSSLFF